MTDAVLRYVVVCDCEGISRIVGWIDDSRSTGGAVVLLTYHPSKYWSDKSENTIRCEKCHKSAQFSEVTSDSVCDLLAENLDKFPTVKVPNPLDQFPTLEIPHPRPSSLIEERYEIPLGVLCRLLSPNR
jgi:hypothetical protein